MSSKEEKPRGDLYARITDRIVAELERGVRPWVKPWGATNMVGRITRPRRHNGQPYTGINVILLWSEAVARGFQSPISMTFKQAAELGAHVRKGESGSTVLYASRFTKTETDAHGDEIEKNIPVLKAYTVFCVDQIEGLPITMRQPPNRRRARNSNASLMPTRSSRTPAPSSVMAAIKRSTRRLWTRCRCHRSRVFATL